MKEWRMDRLKGKIALVSGAARGIGAAIARAFVSEGAWVAVTDINDERGRELVATLGSSSRYYRLDVRQDAEWSTVIDHILRDHGQLDVVVNNAGITGFEDAMVPHDPEHAALEDWRAVLATNLDGTFLGCKHALRAMRTQQAGSIINISSICGIVGSFANAAYHASKGAVRIFSKSAALQYAKDQIRVNSVHPGFVDTPMARPGLLGNEIGKARMDATPLGRFGKPIDIAMGCLYLASDESAWVTGSELVIDGGMTAN